jgi:hypothetical protein
MTGLPVLVFAEYGPDGGPTVRLDLARLIATRLLISAVSGGGHWNREFGKLRRLGAVEVLAGQRLMPSRRLFPPRLTVR